MSMKSRHHITWKTASFCCPSSRVLAAFHFQPKPPVAARASTATWWSMEIPGPGAANQILPRDWNLNPPTKQTVCFHRPHNKIAMVMASGRQAAMPMDTDLLPPKYRTLHPSNGLGTLRNGVRTTMATSQHDVTGFRGFRIKIWQFSLTRNANGSGKCPTLETKLIFHQGPKNSTEPWLWESLSRWWVILKSLQNLGLDTKSWLLYA